MPLTKGASPSMALHTSGDKIYDANGNLVYLRGVGVAGFAPNLYFWEPNSRDAWSRQWDNTPEPEWRATFQKMRDDWHINYIRVFYYVNWFWRDNIIPANEDPDYSHLTSPISTRQYMRNLCDVAAEYGIYVNFCPYLIGPDRDTSLSLDPYFNPQAVGWEGLPMTGWQEVPQTFFEDAGYGSAEMGGNEAGFWQLYWTTFANTFRDKPNAIIEAWNEPGWSGASNEQLHPNFLNYLTIMYNAVRGTGATNLIMMQWRMGTFPTMDMSYCTQIKDALPTANNIVMTTHFYYQAGRGVGADLSPYWAKDYDTLKQQVTAIKNSMGWNVPLVINEEGSCLSAVEALGKDVQDSYIWFENLLKVQRDLGIGMGAYYWLSDNGIGPIYTARLTLLSKGENYTPNPMGQAFIDSYVQTITPTTGPTNNPIITPSPVPLPSTINDIIRTIISEYNTLTWAVVIGFAMVIMTHFFMKQKRTRR